MANSTWFTSLLVLLSSIDNSSSHTEDWTEIVKFKTYELCDHWNSLSSSIHEFKNNLNTLVFGRLGPSWDRGIIRH